MGKGGGPSPPCGLVRMKYMHVLIAILQFPGISLRGLMASWSWVMKEDSR